VAWLGSSVVVLSVSLLMIQVGRRGLGEAEGTLPSSVGAWWKPRGLCVPLSVTGTTRFPPSTPVQGEDPVYVWLPLTAPKPKGPMSVEGVAELQVCLRMQWQREIVRGKSVKVELSLAGAGLLVMGGLQDELFNVTLDDVKSVAIQSRHELQVLVLCWVVGR
jgi:hypothetical protein